MLDLLWSMVYLISGVIHMEVLVGRPDTGRRLVARIVWEIEQDIEATGGRPRSIATKEILMHTLMQALDKAHSTKKNFIVGARKSGYLEAHPYAEGVFWLTEKGRKVAEEYAE